MLTDGPRIVPTATNHAFDLYRPFRGATPLQAKHKPHTVVPVPYAARAGAQGLVLELPPKSIVVISIGKP